MAASLPAYETKIWISGHPLSNYGYRILKYILRKNVEFQHLQKGGSVQALRWVSKLWMAVLALAVLLSAMALGGRLILPRIGTEPALLSVEPADARHEVTTRTQPVLRFNVPMNSRSVERALRIDPPIMARLLWDASFTKLTIAPLENLAPQTSYQITLGTEALSRQLVPLQQPIIRSFQTAQAPVVLTLLPSPGSVEVSVSSPLLIQFSRPMVTQAELGQTRPFTALNLSPQTPGTITWIAVNLALFRPDAPLLAATRYRATLDENLSDVQGETLERSASWEFTTSVPKVLTVAPQDGTRLIASTASLTLTLSQPIRPDRLASMLTISPTIAGILDSALLPNGTQLITFTPSAGWQQGTSYLASFAGGIALPDVVGTRWRFDIAPAPGLIGRYPGEGQTLALGQDIRLIFSTPISAEKLQDALVLDPPADALRVTSIGSEARVSAELRAATSYTLTLPANLNDANGTLLGQAYNIHFRTAAAPPELHVLQSDQHFVQYAPDQMATLKLSLTNVSALSLALYDLDEATLVRAAGFDEADWALFQPERYQQPIRRAWTQPLSLTPNSTNPYQLRLEDSDGKPLPAGAYYLRLRSPDGPRADLVVLISRTRLTLQLGPRAGLVWATDILSSSVQANLPIAIYQDDALVLESTTNALGLLTFLPVGGVEHRYTILARGEQATLIRSDALTLALQTGRGRYRAALLSDSGHYAAGESIQLNGFVRQVITDTLRYAPETTPVTLRLTDGIDLRRSVRGSAEQSTQLRANGVLSASFSLSPGLPPGSYALVAEIAGQSFSTAVQLEPANDPDLRLHVELAERIASSGLLPARIQLTDAAGLPRAGMPISWTLSIEPAPLALPQGFAETLPQAMLPQPISGTTISDAHGRVLLDINLPQTAVGPFRYRLRAEVQGAAGLSSAEALRLANQTASYVAMHPQQQLLSVNEQLRVDLIAVDQQGRPNANIAQSIEIVRLSGGQEQSVLRRTLTSDTAGRSQLVVRLAAGRYQLRAWARDAAEPVVSRSTIGVYQAGLGGTITSADIQPDQQEYQSGDTARLLVRTDAQGLLTLTSIIGPSRFSANVREIGQGEALTVTLSQADLPQTNVHVLALDANKPTGAWLFEQPLLLHDPSEALTVTVESAQQRYLPGATALLTVTTVNNAGQPMAADLIVALVDAADELPGTVHYASAAQQALHSYIQPDEVISQTQSLAMPSPLPRALVWLRDVQTNAQGQAHLALPLASDNNNLRVLVWAASPDAIGMASTSIDLDRSKAVRLALPAFVRPGDQPLITALLDSIDASQAFSLSLQAKQALIQTMPLSQTLSPDQPAIWSISVQNGTQLMLGLLLSSPSSPQQLLSVTRPILSSVAAPVAAEDQPIQVYVLRSYLDPQTGQVLDNNALKLGQIVQVRLMIITLRKLEQLSIYEPFSAGLAAMHIEQGLLLHPTQVNNDHMLLETEQLLPGIYEYRYMVRATIAGLYSQPAVQLLSDADSVPINSSADTGHILP